MKIISIEPTLSPYSIKVNVSKRLAGGETFNFAKDQERYKM